MLGDSSFVEPHQGKHPHDFPKRQLGGIGQNPALPHGFQDFPGELPNPVVCGLIRQMLSGALISAVPGCRVGWNAAESFHADRNAFFLRQEMKDVAQSIVLIAFRSAERHKRRHGNSGNLRNRGKPIAHIGRRVIIKNRRADQDQIVAGQAFRIKTAHVRKIHHKPFFLQNTADQFPVAGSKSRLAVTQNQRAFRIAGFEFPGDGLSVCGPRQRKA
ncbi:MAG: hypothetical protein BWX45_01123 [Deltaproteobacteria bacterium ADurb.Bin002]|nr:MAG: hypothetical protein BWX45_01123 [Deltaproteobacteria bacterium ADurb.Bin002]